MFRTLITQPLTNALVALTTILPGHNLGLAIVALTLIVRVCLFPLQLNAQRTQESVRAMKPELERIKRESKGNKEEEARRTLALYQSHRVNPFTSIIGLIIQIPIFIGLYSVFRHGASIDPNILYSSISIPENIETVFLGISLGSRSLILALIAGLIQFVYALRALPKEETPHSSRGDELSFGAAFNKSMHLQMRYFFPVLITIISLSLPAAVALYWVVNSALLTVTAHLGKSSHSPVVSKGVGAASPDS